MAKVDANDVASQGGSDALRRATEAGAREADKAQAEELGLATVEELEHRHKRKYRHAIIYGLLREGEIIQIVAPPKVGKSWLIYYLALCVAGGRPFFLDEWGTSPGPVVLVDNELHPETIGARIPTLIDKMELHPSLKRAITVLTLRGRLKTMGLQGEDPFRRIVQTIAPIKPRLVILDSLYRIIPAGVNENDNNAMTQVMNRLDEYAAHLGNAAFAVVHHFSKGNQGFKDVTDLGRGAGAMAGAVDTHIALRQHELDDHYVLEAVARTWPPPKPVVLRRDFPIWRVTEEDPTLIRGKKGRPARQAPPDFDDAAFASYLTTERMSSQAVAGVMAKRDGYAIQPARRMVRALIESHHLEDLRSVDGPRDCGLFIAEVHRNATYFRLKSKSE